MHSPKIVGIVNITADSFSDGGRFLDAGKAIDHARQMVEDGADIIELGPASSHPDAAIVSDAEQIHRLEPVLAALKDEGVPISVDAAKSTVQQFAALNGADLINDIQGFEDRAFYPDLATMKCRLIVMHSIVRGEKADRIDIDPGTILDRISYFLEQRIAQLTAAGISRDRLIVDPGMGFFLGTDPETSFTALRHIETLKDRLDLPIMVCVSRKSFLQKTAGSVAANIGAATLAAELFAANQGVDYIRTHDVRALKDALTVTQYLDR